ncbi:MAG: GNAT family N-acetyltransferase [Dehalococcoidales bacterium]|nr:GNAT family N-acetyltransferase [Dehalococcoidales bacterium]
MDSGEVIVTIRLIESTDFEAVLSLSGNVISRDEITSSNSGEPVSFCFVAEAESKVVGFNLAHCLYVGIPLYKICVIQGIVVDDKYRRLGIGEKLVEAVYKQCADCGINTVRALVEESDVRLQQFIEYVGFQRSSVSNYDRPVFCKTAGF